jgi:iron complex outermembrane recepter protein
MRARTLNPLAGTSLLLIASAVAAQTPAGLSELEEIIVTARRVEERLQDVPISIAVFSQQDLANANIVNAADLAQITPGLIANERFGADNSSFAIRGFTQELRTTPSVGVYFADVVAPRGGTPTTSGDGAGPGAFFDLRNVQVLRGPQGNLFGRNTTGGAVLLVPQRPTDEVGGYVEASAGDYSMVRAQAVLNFPVGETVRLRFGVDHQQRDGYLNNVSAIGPDDLADVDYIAARASMVIDLTPNLENYTIGTYTDSSNNGAVSQVFACNGTPVGGLPRPPEMQMCQGSLGGNTLPGDFYDVQNALPNPRSEIKQWQAINTTTWNVTDNLTVKNIASFANLETVLVTGVAGSDWDASDITTSLTSAAAPWVPPAASPHRYIPLMSGVIPGVPTVSQNTLVEELQFQGNGLDSRLTWQAGAYYEHSEPDKTQAGQSVGNLVCDLSTIGVNPADFRCADTRFIAARASPGGPGVGLPASVAANFAGVVNRAVGSTEFENKALYAQSTFDFTDHLSLTGGLRYTWDETTGRMQSVNYFFFPAGAVPFLNASSGTTLVAPTTIRCADPTRTHAGVDANCIVDMQQKSDAPTWLLGLDYRPMDDVLVYTKYARGYRQGGVNIASVPGGYTYEPEEVDTYEIGVKTSFGGPLPGTFNIAVFYNDFSDQQLQLGLLPIGGVGTTAIVNTGASTIQGLELDTRIELFHGFTLGLAYTYLDSEVEEAEHLIVAGNPACGGGPAFRSTCVAGGTTAALVGFPTTFSPKHQGSATASYRLPIPETAGDLTISATYNYTHDYLAVMPAATLAELAVPGRVNPFAEIPSYETVNLSVNWDKIAGSNFDAAVFATNLFDEEYYTFVAGQFVSSAFDYRALARPKMFGGRLRYRF